MPVRHAGEVGDGGGVDRDAAKLYAYHVARIRPEWIERAGAGQLRHSYFDAHWDERRGEVMVRRQSALYGLTVIPGGACAYAPVNREQAREIFIRSALVEGRLASKAAVLAENRALLDEIRRAEHKLRKPGMLVTDEEVFAFLRPVVTCRSLHGSRDSTPGTAKRVAGRRPPPG